MARELPAKQLYVGSSPITRSLCRAAIHRNMDLHGHSYEVLLSFVSEYSSMRTCADCNTDKPLDEFATRSAKCKPCHNLYTRQHYADNKQYYLDKAAKRNQEQRDVNRAWLGEYLATHPCLDCGISDIRVLEFDHRDRSTKIANVSEMVSKQSLQRVKDEVSKCDVRCANCHRIRTGEQFSWYTSLAFVAQ